MDDTMDDEQAATAAAKPQRKQRGSNSFGKGVIRVPQRGGKPDRYGARAGPGQRSVGTFPTPEEAAAAAAEAEAKLTAGISPWDDEQRTNKHKRGEVSQDANSNQEMITQCTPVLLYRFSLRLALCSYTACSDVCL